ETGCWLFMGAHHPGATLPLIHYSSPKRCDDHKEGADDLGNVFLKIATALRNSRQQEALHLSEALSDLEHQHTQGLFEKGWAEQLLVAYEAAYGPLSQTAESIGPAGPMGPP
ncbi:hypothetical protein JB92DRAFT_2737736, partial [Gautieria morchelliformis]